MEINLRKAEPLEMMPEGNDPLDLLPEELWAVITEKLEDSSQILNVIQAIPEVKGAMRARKRYWLFDEIIPHVTKWLDLEDILACRLVCKQWSRAVDSFHQNHPVRRAYSHEHQVTGQIWTVEGRPTTLPFDLPKGLLPSLCFQNQERIRNFLKDMGGPAAIQQGNPFIDRTVFLNSTEGLQGLTGVSEFFQRFGQHVWALSLSLTDSQDQHGIDQGRLCQLIKEWIGHLPNLKCIVGWVPWMSGSTSEAQCMCYPLPPLPHLEILDIAYGELPCPLVNAFFLSYSHQIRRLGFDMKYWRKEFASMFPSITELWVVGIVTKEAMMDLLHTIRAPLLYDLVLTSPLQSCLPLSWNAILHSLKRFPLLRNLTLPSLIFVSGNDAFNPVTDYAPSVKYLSVGKLAIRNDADLLRCFPNLEYLHISQSPRIVRRPPFEPWLRIWNPIIFLKMYSSNVWELLPRLKGITVEVDDNIVVHREDRPYRFRRERYDYLQRMAADDC